MRINATPPLVVAVPEAEVPTIIDGIRPVRPVSAGIGGAVPPGSQGPVGETERAPRQAIQEARRAREDRRGGERRQRQVPVLIDTRTGPDRRQRARREEDEPPPPSVDYRA
jgi:hypothetical protein